MQADQSLWQEWLEKVNRKDSAAIDALIQKSQARLETLARQMLHGYPDVHRWEQTNDILQEALVRLDRALRVVFINDAPHFFRLAALQIRRVLIELARRYRGIESFASHHISMPPGVLLQDQHAVFVDTEQPASLEEWTSFHEAIESLPDDVRDAFQLTWYQGLEQADIARILNVSDRQVRRLLVRAKLHLSKALCPNDSNPN